MFRLFKKLETLTDRIKIREIRAKVENISGNPTYKTLKKAAFQGVSAVNGALGDHLADTRLGIEMAFYSDGKTINATKIDLENHFKDTNAVPTSKICILIHGLTHNETAWDFHQKDEKNNKTNEKTRKKTTEKTNYAALLANDLGYTPFYVRYNTGLHISDNGKAFSDLLETLNKNYPVTIDEICIVAHSMGGLVTHSATAIFPKTEEADGGSAALGSVWQDKVKHIFLLGTPHLGSFLEKFANLTTSILGEVPNYPTRLVGRVINLRSAGIKDLRFGYLRESDWKDKRPDQLLLNHKTPVPKLANTHYFILSGRLTQDEKHWVNQLLGDVLVRNSSALARSENPDEFNFSLENHYEFAKTNHFQLTKMTAVYDKIKEWILTNP